MLLTGQILDVGRVKGRAAGADGLTAKEIGRMPDEWFDDWAILYEVCWAAGRVSSRWVDCRTVMLEKPEGGFRPLSLASVAWRAVASTHVKKLGAWSEEWAAGEATGTGATCQETAQRQTANRPRAARERGRKV